MPLFLITSVCDEGVYENSFKVVEASSREQIAQAILDNPWAWADFLRSTTLWWDLTRYEYKYGEPLGWTVKDLLERIEMTHVDGDSDYQMRIHEIKCIEQISAKQ
ncbi:MAG: hypothetical protein DSM106950_26800 [Stigonema ocellatum SAG 48.90 = DSM 106950]|nr:hypothetical protein [Stigonema ocellatum SAG 48.90 = DSM 106950]